MEEGGKIKKTRKGNAWINAVKKARKQLGITGFQAIKKGSKLYKLAKKIQLGKKTTNKKLRKSYFVYRKTPKRSPKMEPVACHSFEKGGLGHF